MLVPETGKLSRGLGHDGALWHSPHGERPPATALICSPCRCPVAGSPAVPSRRCCCWLAAARSQRFSLGLLELRCTDRRSLGATSDNLSWTAARPCRPGILGPQIGAPDSGNPCGGIASCRGCPAPRGGGRLAPDPQTRYARTADGVHIAYQVLMGPDRSLMVLGWTTNIEALWEEPSMACPRPRRHAGS